MSKESARIRRSKKLRAKLQKVLLDFASKRGLLVGPSQMNSDQERLPEAVGVGGRS